MNLADELQSRRTMERAFLFGLGVLILSALVGLLRPAAFFYGYLSGFLFWSGVPLGAAAILMTHHLTGGRWGWCIRGWTEVVTLTILALPVLFVPMLPGLGSIYYWVREHAEVAAGVRSTYLDLPFFLIRAAVFLGLWALGGWWLVRRTRRQDVGAAVQPAALAAGGLVIWFVTASFAGIDWIGSLQRQWYTSILGLYILVGQALSGLALVILLGILARHPALDPDRLNDLGNLLLTFVVLDEYLAYSQFFIIWNGNLPHEASWYAPRMQGFWAAVSVLLMVIHFALPMFALFFRVVKRTPGALAVIAGIVLVARIIDSIWMVMPSATQAQALGTVLAVAAVIGLGGLWLGVLVWFRRRAPMLVVAQPLEVVG